MFVLYEFMQKKQLILYRLDGFHKDAGILLIQHNSKMIWMLYLSILKLN